MDATHQANDEQTTLWNGPAGRAWVEAQELLDRALKPFEDLLVEAVSAASAARVLDVGCGTGSTTLAVARRLARDPEKWEPVFGKDHAQNKNLERDDHSEKGHPALGAQGRSIGIDISEPMIAFARARAEREGTPASFIRADAQTHAFAPASFDMIVSRFGVMFFEDPVRAFANLRRAARDDAALRFVAFRSAAENPFMTTAERAAAPLLPGLPARRPDAPGQFAFADRRRVVSILEESGWAEIDIRPIDVACTLPEQDLMRYASRLGPVGLILQQADERTRTQVIETVRAAFDPYVLGAEVRFTSACWMVGARASSAPAGERERRRDDPPWEPGS
ncbi:MAG: class I SAM-dependent methyltransferase [Xanthobacteraceae bacterium]